MSERRLLVASTNPGKIREIRLVLAGLPLVIETLDDHPAVPEPEEPGETFAENARAKALYYARATGRPTVAEDSGLEVAALGGAPGVRSARYNGSTYAEKFERLYAELRARGAVDSPARFVCALALVEDGRVLFEAEGIVEGRIAPAPRGTNGFGYDPIFFYPPYGRTLAEVSDEEKLAVSHRGRAFRKLRRFLATAWAESGGRSAPPSVAPVARDAG
ncbi:MAG TPA: RdgB/HAM1 family non-canonical purine NTP pyrophosphatase [Vicinamibacterales bacterium]|nr:RdgB/HAM1 family non-canonical purine NTP pyrophosphatase [Vicinamibacterales bacterium]